jgi:hypothetical protein
VTKFPRLVRRYCFRVGVPWATALVPSSSALASAATRRFQLPIARAPIANTQLTHLGAAPVKFRRRRTSNTGKFRPSRLELEDDSINDDSLGSLGGRRGVEDLDGRRDALFPDTRFGR